MRLQTRGCDGGDALVDAAIDSGRMSSGGLHKENLRGSYERSRKRPQCHAPGAEATTARLAEREAKLSERNLNVQLFAEGTGRAGVWKQRQRNWSQP